MTARTTTHENRKGDTFYIHAKATKTGVTTYFATKKRDHNKAVDAMPTGYEFYESPQGAVTVRRIFVSEVSDVELAAIEMAVESLITVAPDTVMLDRCKSYVTLWTADESTMKSLEYGLGEGWAKAFPHSAAQMRKSCLQFMVCMRFCPVDPKETRPGREFLAERFCYRGSVDSWIFLAQGSLNQILKKYLPHAGRTSLFELW